MAKTDEQVIWRNLSIGSPDAESDRDLLESCFVDPGILGPIRSVSAHASIVLGRTGHGKSAVLLRLQALETHAIELKPIELAFRFVENSTVISFFESAGVNLALFYRLLWRHVLVSEAIKHRFNLQDQNALARWVDSFVAKFDRDSAKAKSIAYLRQWGDNFWKDTEVRLSEITKQIESKLSASLEGSALAAKIGVGGSQTLSEGERVEVVTRGSTVVSQIQIGDLNRVMKVLAEEAFDDDKKRYYITIDGLDEDWVSKGPKYRLIRALIEEVRTFRGELPNVKVIAALRQDLIEKVFEETRDGGFQEEKYEVYYARLMWSREDLLEMLRMRVNEVFRRKYTGETVELTDVFPKARGDQTPYEYMLERTFLRPRDLIAFGNECFFTAAGRQRVSWQAIYDAEITYSRKRKNALIDEWITSFPSIKTALDAINGMPESFSRSALSDAVLDGVTLQLSTYSSEDDLVKACKKLLDPKSSATPAYVLSELLRVLYHVGAIGLKFSAESPYIWSFRDQSSISNGEAKRVMSVKIHKMLWKALDTRTGNLYQAKKPT